MGSGSVTSSIRRTCQTLAIRERDLEQCRIEVRCLETGMSRIVEGSQEVEVLAFWTTFSGRNGFTNSGMASQPTSERPSECNDDTMARLYSLIRLHPKAYPR